MGIVGFLILLIIAILVIYQLGQKMTAPHDDTIEMSRADIDALAGYVRAQKEAEEEKTRIAAMARAEKREKLELYKQTKEQLRENLRTQIDTKAWYGLSQILNNADKGTVGIYIIHNVTKGKYYVGQAKQINKRVRDHFAVSDMAMDMLRGDQMQVKYLTAGELGGDYRLDHVEKTAIEIFDADKSGYNKTTGNM